MDPLFQDERISAYLDGQMPPDERSQFEDELARNGELRQVVEELRGLQDSLQALPRHRLNDDFAEHVLRRAERAMLSDSSLGGNAAARASGDAVEDDRVLRATASNSTPHARRSRRPWIWAAIAIAVAVMLMVLNPPPKKHDEIARVDTAPRAGFAPHASAPQLDKPNEARHERQLAVPAKRSGGLQSLAQDAGPSDAAAKAEQMHGVGEGNGVGGEPVPKDGAAPAAGFGSRREVAKAASPPHEPVAAPQAAQAEKSLDSVAGAASTPQSNVELRQNGIRSADAPSGASSKPSAGAVPAGQTQFFAGSGERSGAKGAVADAKNAADEAQGAKTGEARNREQFLRARSLSHVPGEQAKESLPAGDMIVADVETRSEVTPAKLQQLLDKRGITLNNSPAALLALTSAVQRASKPGWETTAPTDALKLADSDRSAEATRTDESPLEVVYVLGTREQVMGLVDDLHSQPAQYRTLAVTTLTPEAALGLEKDIKAEDDAIENRDLVEDRGGAAGKDRSDKKLGAVRKQSQPVAPAAPLAPAALAASAAPAPVAPAPLEESAIPSEAADSEAAAAPAERSNGAGWAAQMRLRSDAESLLRKSLAQAKDQPASDKAKSDAREKQQGMQHDKLARHDSEASSDQMQAVLVFRMAPVKAAK